jgi:hypothetical protein
MENLVTGSCVKVSMLPVFGGLDLVHRRFLPFFDHTVRANYHSPFIKKTE